MSKYLHIAELIKGRIEHGDYDGVSLPGAQSLAVETACSYMTVRQALQKLTSDGILKQLSNGRLVAAPKQAVPLKAGMLRPVWSVSQWETLIYTIARSNGCSFRLFQYNHPKDEALYDAFDCDLDLLFVAADVEDELFLRKLERNKERVVTLFQDFTSLGVRCLDGVAPEHMKDLVVYLAGLGHKRVDFVFPGVMNSILRARLEFWRQAVRGLGIQGEEAMFPCERFEDVALVAKRAFDKRLASGFVPAKANICFNAETALGTMRSLYEKGLRVPQDVSIACFGDGLRAGLFIPSVTAFSAYDHSPEIKALFDFYLGRGGDPSRLMYRTNSAKLVVGESTGPCH